MVLLKFLLIDLFVLGLLVLVNGLALLPAVWWTTLLLQWIGFPWGLAVAIPLGYFTYLFAFALVNGLFKWLLVGRLSPGEFDFKDPEAQRWRLNMLFTTTSENFCIANIKLSLILKYLYFRLQGSHIDFLTLTSINGGIYEPELITIGSSSIIGGNAIVLNDSKIGDEVVVGTGALVGRGVQIGDRSVVLSNACLKDGTIVGPDEIWGGVPARKLKDRKT